MKDWRDLFYYSAGERRALLLLSILIVGILFVLWLTAPDNEPLPLSADVQQTAVVVSPTDSHQSVDSSPPIQKKQPVKSSNTAQRKFNTPFYLQKRPYVSNKYKPGTVVELNAADSVSLQKVPGIGPSFARRIIRYRELLGGFYSVSQLSEVYGIDEERFHKLFPWFVADTALIKPLCINSSDFRTLLRHPYLNKSQVIAISECIRQKGRLDGWSDIMLLDEFDEHDVERLKHYLSFE